MIATAHAGTTAMSMWMRMPGETWLAAAASFVALWLGMMAAMMLPSLLPLLWRYRRGVVGTGTARLAGLTAIVAVGYFTVWGALGAAIFPLGVAVAAAAMRSPLLARAAPLAIGSVVLIAGAIQLTRWKAHHLACCRQIGARDPTVPADARAAWRKGLRFGMHCVGSSAGLTAILVVVGMMDPRAMAVATAAITAERLAPAGERIARAIGGVALGAGVLLIARSVGLG